MKDFIEILKGKRDQEDNLADYENNNMLLAYHSMPLEPFIRPSHTAPSDGKLYTFFICYFEKFGKAPTDTCTAQVFCISRQLVKSKLEKHGIKRSSK